MVGNMDPSVTIESMVQSSEHVEKFSVKVITGAQHFPHQEKPDDVNKAIIKFFVGKSYFTHINFSYKFIYKNYII